MHFHSFSSILGRLLRTLSVSILVIMSSVGVAIAEDADHREFEATLHVPFRGDKVFSSGIISASESRIFTMTFEYPSVERKQIVAWRLELVNWDGTILKRWRGAENLFEQKITVSVHWSGLIDGVALADGQYRVRMFANSNDATSIAKKLGDLKTAELTGKRNQGISDSVVDDILGDLDNTEVVDQTWSLMVGNPSSPAMPTFEPLATSKSVRSAVENTVLDSSPSNIQAKSQPAVSSLPYTVYYGNLHSQTNHSDGGGDVSTCKDAQSPQAAPFGPSDAYQFASGRGLDFLVTSEHNHLFDGSTGTNSSANPAIVKSLYQSGLTAAANFNASQPNFLAVYGMEWGVINNGGHLNIFNSNELLGWETNSSGQLLADTLTAKGDYASLYRLMNQRGLVGQFNHPATSGQFNAGGVDLGYTADGDAVMALCEVLNTSAFSSNTSETETSRSTYESACQKLLEAGYHVAFSTDQDNHCANWGASYTNRTGVLVSNGASLTRDSFISALKARRVFASMDKNSQLILTANGRLMGERFSNSGAMTLVANFANSAGRSVASVQVIEGVPGRNGAVSTLSNTAVTTFTPALGEHFYYAKVTQDDGKILWSAPVWISQTNASSDSTPPTVSASESGSGGNITLSASASDNVGVTNVEFYVDGVLKGSKAIAPYAISLDSTTLANGTHSLVAKAFDAANNSASSAAIGFSVNNVVATSQELIVNGGFESGTTGWTGTTGDIGAFTGEAPFQGTTNAWMGGNGSATTETLAQTIAIPSTATSASLSFYLHIDTAESGSTAYDKLAVQVRNTSGTVLKTLATYSNANAAAGYQLRTFDLTIYKGQTIQIYFSETEDSSLQTSFVLDNVSLIAK